MNFKAMINTTIIMLGLSLVAAQAPRSQAQLLTETPATKSPFGLGTLEQDRFEKTVGKITPNMLDKYPNFEEYWKLGRAKNAPGKAFEWLIAKQDNTRFTVTNDRYAIRITAADGYPSAPHDLELVDRSTGKILKMIQCKMGFGKAEEALTDTKYAGMDILTTEESYKALELKSLKAVQKAARRILPLNYKDQVLADAIKSGRLMKSTPSGLPLPQYQEVENVAKAGVKQQWNALKYGESTLKNGFTESAGTLSKGTLPELPELGLAEEGLAGSEIVTTAVVSEEAAGSASFVQFLKSPGVAAGTATFVIDGGLAIYDLNTGQINKTEFTEKIQDAVTKAAAVGGVVQVLYILTATPQGLVVAGVAIAAYATTNYLLQKYREANGRHFKVADLEGIAPAEFLQNANAFLSGFDVNNHTHTRYFQLADLRGIAPAGFINQQK